MKYLTLFLILLAVGCSHPQPEPIDFDFRGVKIGDPVPEYAKDGVWVSADQTLMKSNVGTYGVQGDIYIRVRVLNGAVAGFLINGGNDLKNACVNKFGEHHYDDESGIYWHTTDGTPLRFKDGILNIATHEFNKEKLEALKRREKEQAEKINL